MNTHQQRLETSLAHKQSGTKNAQQGAVLIVSLVMLTILTIIAVGSVTDIGLQSNMARNSQISMRAFNTVLSELRAQFQASTNNAQIDSKPYQQVLSDAYQTGTPFEAPPEDLQMASVDNPFQQDFTITFIREDRCGGGNQLGSTALIYEFSGAAYLRDPDTGIKSNQVLGVCYPNPQQ